MLLDVNEKKVKTTGGEAYSKKIHETFRKQKAAHDAARGGGFKNVDNATFTCRFQYNTGENRRIIKKNK